MMENIIIIGGGLAGVSAALEAASKGFKVLLIEKCSELLPDSCTSNNQCFKLHLGPHYALDLQTAERCLLNSIAFARKYSEFIELRSPQGRGRYYIMEHSMVKPESAMAIVRHLQLLYTNLVLHDPSNEVLGSPEDFVKELHSSNDQHFANAISCIDLNNNSVINRVMLRLETAECQVNFTKLRQYLRQEIANHPNITLLNNTKITSLRCLSNRLGYQVIGVSVDADGQQQPFIVDCQMLVNCSWENIEYLANTLNSDAHIDCDETINRLKVSIKVKLPSILQDFPTISFAIGPYCTMTNLGDGTVILTCERLTNVGYWNSNTIMPDNMVQLISTLT